MSWKDPSSRRDLVYLLLSMVPIGYTITYGTLAELTSTSPRAIGVYMKTNSELIVIPCHRVLATKGLGGFSRGLEFKAKLLRIEDALDDTGRPKRLIRTVDKFWGVLDAHGFPLNVEVDP